MDRLKRIKLRGGFRRADVEALERRRLLAVAPAGGEFAVNVWTTMSQTGAAVAMEPDGDFVIVWQSFAQDGAGYGIYARRYDAAGTALGDEFKVNVYTTSTQANPAVAANAAGFVVAWRSDGQDGSGDAIVARRYNAAGSPLGDEFVVNTFTTDLQSLPAIAMDDAGNFVIAWQSDAQDGSVSGIYAQRFASSGAPQGGEFIVNSFTTGAQTEPAVAMDADGDFVITWQSDGQDGSGAGIYAQRFNTAGAPQGAEFPVNIQTAGTQANPATAMDANGNFVLAWESDGVDGSGRGIVIQRYSAAGIPIGAQSLVNTFTPSAQRNVAAAMDDSGQFVIAWQSDGQDGSGQGIYARHFDSSGAAVEIEFRVNSYTTDGQTQPAIAMDADGDFVAAWKSDGQDGSFDGVFAQRYRLVPAVVESSFLFETAPQRLRFRFDQDVSASLGLDDIVIQTLPGGPNVTPAGLSYDPATNTATFTFGAILADSNFRATLLAAGITNPAGAPMVADVVFDFFFLRGDANHDGRVNLQDFNILAANFGQMPRTFSQGDFNYDSIVNLQDFNLLAGRFGQMLSAAPERGGSIFELIDPDDFTTERLC